MQSIIDSLKTLREIDPQASKEAEGKVCPAEQGAIPLLVNRLGSKIFTAGLMGCALLFTDEASFRQDSTLHAIWSLVGCPLEVPVTGQRKSVKIFGTVELWYLRFDYRE